MSYSVENRLHELLEKEGRKKHTHTILLGVQSKDKTIDFTGTYNHSDSHSPYFIASVTKLYTLTILMQLVDAGLLDLDAPLTTYLPSELIDHIHVYDGVDYSHQLKVYQLIHQTSGLGDYFEASPNGISSVLDDIKQGKDRSYSVEDVVKIARGVKPSFPPDANNGHKSHYSDTNYQLLGAIIEAITEKSIAENFKIRIFDRLGLTQSYLFNENNPRAGEQPLPYYNQDQRISVPGVMTSERGAGGIVSTVPESLIFLNAFFDGQLFDAKHFTRMTAQWNGIFFPLQYGYGMMRFQLPRAMNLFRYSPELIGHSGATGSFAFYAPKEKLYLAGTFNQIDKQSRPFAFMLKVINIVTK